MKTNTTTSANDPTLRLLTGHHLCRITFVEDHPPVKIVRIDFDFADGVYQGYYELLRKKYKCSPDRWAGTLAFRYGEDANDHFAHLICAIESSNPGFQFDGTTMSDLTGKLVRLPLHEGKYLYEGDESWSRVGIGFVISDDVLKKALAKNNR